MKRTNGWTPACMAVAALAPVCAAQSLFHAAPAQPPPPAPGGAPGGEFVAAASDSLYETSLFAIRPPEEKKFRENDLITILINESSQMKRDQKLDTKKDYTFDAPRIEPWELLKFVALSGNQNDVNPLATLQLKYHNELKSKGDYERTDTIVARITARVLEVKPNGTLLLEARTSTRTDKESQTFLLSGVCRSDDVTARNTILSNQIYDLKLDVQHEGQVSDTTKKGIIPIVLETLFNF